MSVHGYRFSQLKKLSIGLNIGELMDEFYSYRDNRLLEVPHPEFKHLGDGVIEFPNGAILKPVKQPAELDSMIEFYPIGINRSYEVDPLHRVSDLCQYYFDLDKLVALIPEKFWNEDRAEEKPFRDFLSIYKF